MPELMFPTALWIALTATTPVTAGAGDELARLEMKPVALTLRDGDTVTVQRGDLTVPILRSDPESKPITIDVWRFPAVDGVEPGTPPIFQLHGGPGWPGLQLKTGDYEDEILPMVRHADLVVVGQRGIGSSKPNTACGWIAAPPDGEERTREEQDEALRAACAACRASWESQGYDLRGFNVLEAAADVDDIRRLLGYEEITLWGASFGSHWAMAVMRYHADGVARAVLTGMEGPDHTYDMPSGVLASLERLAAEAELSSAWIDQVPEGGFIEALKSVIAQVEVEPIVVEVDGKSVRIEAEDVRAAALGYSAGTGSRTGARSWPADVFALHQGDFERMARAKLAEGGFRGLPTASFFMLDCGSGISPARLETLQSDPAAAVVGDLGHWYQTACSAWNADLGEAFRAGFTTDIPTVIVHGSWDTSTPLDNAVELLPSFANMHFVLVDGGSHGALGEAMRHSAAFRSGLMGFVATGEMGELPLDVRLPPLDWAAPY